VWAGSLQRQAAVAVGQGLGGHAVAGLGPLGLREWPLGGDTDAFTVDVDLGGLFPASADSLIGDARVVGGHLVRVVVEQDTDDLLGTSRLINRQAKVCRHWWGVSCTGWPWESQMSQRRSHRRNVAR
jgi:hypothetical protein